jgi:glycosyltransferase involved in cell wall biosynthesis
MKKIDVSVVLNMHREALYLRPTLLSLEACVMEASKAGINVELIAVFDRADGDTLAVFHQTPLTAFEQVKTTEIDVGSLGLARNAGVELSEGEYIWTADGDDLVSRNAIVQMVNTARSHRNPRVAVFIEFLAAFGEQYHVVRYVGSEWLTAADYAYQHPFVSRLFVHRDVFEHQRYQDLKVTTGFAYEDWDFNCRLLADGYQFAIAPDTVFFYRQRFNSLLKQANATSARLIPHNPLFEPYCFQSLMKQARNQHPDWNDFLKRRQSLYKRDFAKELLQSESMKKHIVEAARLDPEVEPYRIAAASSYWSVPWDNRHWGFQLEIFFRMVGATEFTDVVLLPWLKPGGAEKYILQILDELKAQGLAGRILVLSGEAANKHEWVSKLPKDSVFIDLYNSFPTLDEFSRISLATRAMLAIVREGGRLHLKTSKFAHEVMERYGAALSSKMQPIYYRFNDYSVEWEGQRIRGVSGVKHLRQQMPNLAMLISDCKHILQNDERTLGVSAAKHQVIFARCDQIQGIARDTSKPSKRLLWCSRISAQKRPELLLLLGSTLKASFPDLVIDVFGHCEAPYTPSMFDASALRYRGTYGSFAELPLDQYDACVYTSAFDGLPNVILEALGAGLPVIAPDVGGISEAVIEGETGFLLDDHVDDDVLVNSYVQVIGKFYANWTNWSNLSDNAKALVATRHSQKAFSASVANVFTSKQEIQI